MLVEAQSWKPEQGQILLVEDDEFFGIALQDGLTRAGFDVVLHTSGKAALDAIAAGASPRCVVTDLHMPEMNGFELLQRLRETGPPQGVPVIVLSGEDEPADIAKSFRLGATSFLSKPIQPVLLAHHIQLVLRAVQLPA